MLLLSHTASGYFHRDKCSALVKDVDGIKTINRHPKFMIRFLLRYSCRLNMDDGGLKDLL